MSKSWFLDAHVFDDGTYPLNYSGDSADIL